MNDAKQIIFFACSLMMSAAIHGMELEKSNEPFISQDRIFVWSPKERQYYGVTELGDVSADNILQKNDQPHKVYRAQLVIKEDKEGKEGKKCFLRTTQEFVSYYTGNGFVDLLKYQRKLIPISFSQEQGDTMWHRFRSCHDNKKEAILVMDNENNVYFITHVYDGKEKKRTKGEFNHEQFRRSQLMKFDIANLKEEVAQLQKQMKELIRGKETLENQTSVDLVKRLQDMQARRNRNIFICNIMEYGSIAALIAILWYTCRYLIPQYQG